MNELTSDREALVEQIERQLVTAQAVEEYEIAEVARLEAELSDARARRRSAKRDCEVLSRSLRELNGEAAESRRRKRADSEARSLLEEEGSE